jgi:3-keto-5-aminohexanoate cleavage enzyme
MAIAYRRRPAKPPSKKRIAMTDRHKTQTEEISLDRRRFVSAACAPLLMAGLGAFPAAAAAHATRRRVETPGKTWIEVALNGPWSRDLQPLIPISVEKIVEDGIACARAGAAVVHVHAYDVETGRQKDDADLYVAIIEGIRAKEDVIVYPTVPFAGHVDAPEMMTAQVRFAHTETLARRGLLEWAVVDPGSTNITRLEDIPAGKEGFVYANPESHIRRGLELATRYKFHPGYALYEPAFVRLGAALERAYRDVPQCIYRFMFSDGLSFGFPPRRYGLDAFLHLLEEEAPHAPWMIAGLDVDITSLIPYAVERGGHVRVGLEDARFGARKSNVQLVEEAVRLVRAAGKEPATTGEIRQALART